MTARSCCTFSNGDAGKGRYCIRNKYDIGKTSVYGARYMVHGKWPWSLPFVPRGWWYAPLYLEHKRTKEMPRSLYQQQLVTSLTDLLANINRGLCGYTIYFFTAATVRLCTSLERGGGGGGWRLYRTRSCGKKAARKRDRILINAGNKSGEWWRNDSVKFDLQPPFRTAVVR